MISKTDYITYLKHPAWLWLRKHDPDFLPTPDDNSQAIIDEGREFEKLAEQIFPEAIHLDRNNYADMQEWANETKTLLEQGVDTILQAAFLYDDFLCIADAITKDGDAYMLTEIKATTSPDKEHICDLSFQKTVIEWSGFPVRTTQVLHANKEYLRSGDISLKVLQLIDSVIPRPVLFTIIRPDGQFKYTVSYKERTARMLGKSKIIDYYTTSWGSRPLATSGQSVKSIYVNFIKQIEPAFNPLKPLSEAAQDTKMQQQIRKQIDRISKKITSEPSVARKQEFARRRHELEQTLIHQSTNERSPNEHDKSR